MAMERLIFYLHMRSGKSNEVSQKSSFVTGEKALINARCLSKPLATNLVFEQASKPSGLTFAD